MTLTTTDVNRNTSTDTQNVTVNEQPPGNTITGTSGNGFLEGTTGTDILNGEGGNDDIPDHGGDDTLNGDDGNDWLDGGLVNNTYQLEDATVIAR